MAGFKPLMAWTSLCSFWPVGIWESLTPARCAGMTAHEVACMPGWGFVFFLMSSIILNNTSYLLLIPDDWDWIEGFCI